MSIAYVFKKHSPGARYRARGDEQKATQLLATSEGIELVERALSRIEHNIPSRWPFRPAAAGLPAAYAAHPAGCFPATFGG